MIDYEKLKLAHELYSKIQDEYWIGYFWPNYTNSFLGYFRLSKNESTEFEDFDTIDSLITKLQELTQPKSKYEIGQEVFALKRRGVVGLMSGRVKEYDSHDNYYIVFTGSGGYWLNEEKIYPSREALIQEQIDYWESLKFDDAIEYVRKNHDGTVKNLASKECQHESDGGWYYSHGERICGAALHFANAKPDKYKCKKCGEFY